VNKEGQILLKKYRINIPDKSAALGRYEVIIEPAKGETIREEINAYSYAGVFEVLCEKYENQLDLKVDSITIKAIH